MRRADNLTTLMKRLSSNLEASTTWNPQGLSRPVMGLLYLIYRKHNNVLYRIIRHLIAKYGNYVKHWGYIPRI